MNILMKMHFHNNDRVNLAEHVRMFSSTRLHKMLFVDKLEWSVEVVCLGRESSGYEWQNIKVTIRNVNKNDELLLLLEGKENIVELC